MPLHFRSLVLVLVLVVVVSLSLFGSIVAIATAAVASSAILPTRSTSISMSSTASTESTPTGVAARLARPNILELQPYRCARDDYSTGILLDANENAYGSPLQKNHPNHRKNPQQNSATVQEPITTTTATENLELERYPDPYQIPLKEKVAAYRNHQTNNNNNSILAAPPSQQQQQQLTPDHIFVGVGSDEAIDLLFRIFCRPAIDTIVTTPPTYGMYKVCAKINDVGIVSVPLTPAFDVDIAAVRTCIVRFVCVCALRLLRCRAVFCSVSMSVFALTLAHTRTFGCSMASHGDRVSWMDSLCICPSPRRD